LIIQMILMLALSLITAAMHVSYRDLAPVVTLGLQVWLYLTPVSYPMSIVPAEWRSLYILNPMAGLIESYRDVVVHARAPQLDALAASVIISIVLFVGGYIYFKHAERAFADVI
jgi:lipopolysaccharide transport system permease protein